MLSIVFFSRFRRDRIHAQSYYFEPAPLDPANYLTYQAPLYAIGFYHHVSALQCLTLRGCFSSGFSSRFSPLDFSRDPSKVQITLAFGGTEIKHCSIFPGIKLACAGFYCAPTERAFPFSHDLTLTLISLLLVRFQGGSGYHRVLPVQRHFGL